MGHHVFATEQALEVLNDAHQAVLHFGDFTTCADPRGYIRSSNRLLDACLDAGMSEDEPCHHAWTAIRVADWLSSSANTCDCGANIEPTAKLCASCVAEYRAEFAMAGENF